MKRLFKLYLNSLSSLDEDRVSWKSCVVHTWIVIGIPLTLITSLIGMAATLGLTEIDYFGVPRSGFQALLATMAVIILGIPVIFAIVGSIMWFDHRFIRWPWRKSVQKTVKK